MKNRKLTICLDFDGVIADTGELKRIIATELTGKLIALAEASGERVRSGESSLTKGEWNTIRDKVYFDAESIGRILPVKDSISTINQWLSEGHTVKVVTARTGQMHADAVSWIKKHGLDIPVIGAGARTTKVPHLIDCDIFVDDDADRALEAQAVCRAYFFKWPYNDKPKGIKSILSLAEIKLT